MSPSLPLGCTRRFGPFLTQTGHGEPDVNLSSARGTSWQGVKCGGGPKDEWGGRSGRDDVSFVGDGR